MEGYENCPHGWKEVNDNPLNSQKTCQKMITTTHKNILEKNCTIAVDNLDENLDILKNYSHEIVMVLAGGLNEYCQNHSWVVRRLELALALYKQKPRLIICLGGGTYHKAPCLNKLGFVIHESTECIKYLLSNGVSSKHLMREWSSYDTIANAYFSLTNYIMPSNYQKKILIITSDFHMPRTQAIFSWIYNLSQPYSLKPTLDFLAVSSSDLDDEIISARVEREKQSLLNLTSKIKEIKTLEAFVLWFYTEHKAYNCEMEEVDRRSTKTP